MEDTRKRERRRSRHARNLARCAIAEAGTPTKVGEAVGRAPSTVAHWTSDRECPEVRDFFEMAVRISQHPDLDADALLQRLDDAIAFDSLVMVDTDRLIEEGLYLKDFENEVGAREDCASMVSDAEHEKWLARVERASARLRRVSAELRERGVSLDGEYRRRRVS